MLLSTQTLILAKEFSYKESLNIIKQAGFDAYDITLLSMHNDPENDIFSQDDYITAAKELRMRADNLGLICNQAHAPFRGEVYNEEAEKRLDKDTIKAIEIAAILGAKIIVVHPKQYLRYPDHVEELFQINMEYYKSLIPYAQKYSIKIAVENMYQCNNNAGIPSDSTCSRAKEFCKYLDTLNSEWIVGCLDIGHVSLMKEDIVQFIKKMGNKRLQALHIHDTNLVKDCHTLPFTEKIDYIAVAKALGEIDYQGDFTYEADVFYLGKPKELYCATAKYMCEVGRYLIDKIEESRNNHS